jgi:hypothetical protein
MRAVLVFLLVAATAVLTGCSVQVRLQTVIHRDGSSEVALRVAADRQIQDLLAEQGGQTADGFFRDLTQQSPPGWKTEQGTDPDGTRWAIVARSFANLDELDRVATDAAGPVVGLGLRDVSVAQSRGVLTETTSFSAVADPAQAVRRISPAQQQQAGQVLSSVLRIENRLRLPGWVSQSNADSKEGGALVWRLSPTEATQMRASSIAVRWGVVAVVLLCLSVAVLGVVLGVLTLRRGRKARESQDLESSGDGPGEAGR